MRSSSQTLAVAATGHGRLSRLRLIHPDADTAPAYDAGLARQLLEGTTELPSGRRALVTLLTEYRRALSDLVRSDETSGSPGQPDRSAS
jgi:hypothetical protein